MDASALVKRYNQKEKGSGFVRQLFDKTDVERLMISPCISEVIYTFYRLAFDGQITEDERNSYIACLSQDVMDKLIRIYSPTGADALYSAQIAQQVFTQPSIKKRLGPIDILLSACAQRFSKMGIQFVCSDKDLNYIVRMLQIPVIDPEEVGL